MTTSAIEPASREDRSDRAQRAVRAFRAMQPGLTGYARAITGRKDIVIELSTGTPRTDGKKIFFKPPIALGDGSPHERHLCERRDKVTRQQLCLACCVRERVLITIYHEIAHIAFGTFDPTSERSKNDAMERAIEEAPGKWAQQIRNNWDNELLDYKKNDYLNLSSLISPHLPTLINVLEDARVDEAMFKARKGTRVMFDAYVQSIFAEGNEAEDGTMIRWSDKPLNSQVIIGVFVLACQYSYKDWFHSDVEAALGDKRLRELITRVDTLRSAEGTYNLAFPILARLRELGFCRLPEEPEDDQTEPEPETEPTPEEENVDEQDVEQEPDSNEGEDDDDQEADSPGDGQPDDQCEPGIQDDRYDERDSGVDGGTDEGAPDEGYDPDGEEEGSPGEDDDAVADESISSDSPECTPASDGKGEPAQPSDDEGSSEGFDGSEAPGKDGTTAGDESQDGDRDLGGEDLEDSRGPVPDEVAEGSSPAAPEEELEADDETKADADRTKPTSEAGDSGGEDKQADGDNDHPVSGSDGEGSGDQDEPEGHSDDVSDLPGTADDAGEGDFEDVEAADAGGEYDAVSSDERPEWGDPRQAADDVQVFSQHDPDTAHGVPEAADEVADEAAIEVAIIQGIYFEKPSINVTGVREHKFGLPTTDSSGRDVSTAWDDEYGNTFYSRRAGIATDLVIPEQILGPGLLEMRRAFSDNQRANFQRGLKSGRVNGRVLGKRAPVQDSRLFQKKRLPGKKSYAVLIGIDISGSTVGQNLALIKRAAKAQAELCKRAGIDFAMFAHTANGEYSNYDKIYLDIYEIKSFDAPWDSKANEALEKISSDSQNLDGHTVEYYRKHIERHPATDKIIMYYTDGHMPAENYNEELEILQREIAICKKLQITLMGVGIRTDSPIRHGLDTVRVDDDSDIVSVVRHLQKGLLHHR